MRFDKELSFVSEDEVMLSSGGRRAGWLKVDGGPQRAHGLVAFVERAMLASVFKGGRALSYTCMQE